MSTELDTFVVILRDRHGRRKPFGPSRDKASAEHIAVRLREWGMHADVERGRVEHGEFIAASETTP